MKKVILISASLLLLIANVRAIKIKFTVASMSVNTAEGSIGIFTSFKVYPNDYSNPDSLNLIDFSLIDYNDISEVLIEEIRLSEQSKTSFSQTAVFPVTSTSTFGNKTNTNFIQGNTYAFRLSVMTKSGQKLNLLNKSTSTEIANSKMNCAKLNNIYRKSCHNCFQESIVDPDDGGFYQSLFYTRVVELDVHASNNPGTWNWDVRHTQGLTGGGNKNNCSNGNKDEDQAFGWCLDNLKTWHNDHPNHDVIILFIDLKSEWNKNNNNQTPANLDDRLEADFGSTNIYKPKDLSGNFTNMRLAAQRNNWPSMGDLTGKFIFVLTGDGDRISEYIAQRNRGVAVAFCAANVHDVDDVNDLSRENPNIASWAENDIVFYNVKRSDDLNAGLRTSNLGYINRVWNTSGFPFYIPKEFTNAEYNEAINFSFNNIAVADIDGNYNPVNNGVARPVDGIQYLPNVDNSYLSNTHIYSPYANTTQAATQTITAANLVVEPGANYRMIAGESITLLPGTELKAGSNVVIRIDNCSSADYSLRQASYEELTQEQIDALMHELDKELYTYTPENEKEIVRLNVYPNPTSEIINISYTNYLLNAAVFTLYDLTGRVIKTKIYSPKSEGTQKFNLNTKDLKNGTYFYTLQVGEKIHNGKIIKID